MNVLIIDLETTGFDPNTEKIAEIGAILFNVEKCCATMQFSTLLPIQRNEASKVNGIPVIDPLYYTLEPYWSMVDQASYLIGHNIIKFDKKFLEKNSLLPELPILDTMVSFPWSNGYPKLRDVAIDHGIPVWKPHRALYDCSLLAHIFECYTSKELQSMIENAVPKTLYISLEGYPSVQSKANGFVWNRLVEKRWAKFLKEGEAQSLPFKVKAIS